MKYESNNTWTYSCKYHIIWCPKYRRKVLTNGIDNRLKELLNNWQEELDYQIIEQEIMPDHVHLLIQTTPDVSILNLVKSYNENGHKIFLKNILLQSLILSCSFGTLFY